MKGPVILRAAILGSLLSLFSIGCPVDDLCAASCRNEKDPAACVAECEKNQAPPEEADEP